MHMQLRLLMLVPAPMKDGVLRERGFQARCTDVTLSGVSLTVSRSQFISIGSLRFVISLLK
jgi:hypothetical protein